MSLLRIRCSLADAPARCEWALVDAGRAPVRGEGRLAELPRRAARVQLVLPAEEVLLTRARLPAAAKRRPGSVLAFAVEEETLGEPESNWVSWLGRAGDADALAVVDRQGMTRWLEAIKQTGYRNYEVHCETLMLPWTQGEWCLGWDGKEGFLRSGEFDGAATDCGDRRSTPLSLRLALDAAAARESRPEAIAIHPSASEAAPDLDAWQRELGVRLRLAAPWDWASAPPHAGVKLMDERRLWLSSPVLLARLRPAVWIAVGALAIHGFALVADWTLLAGEQRALRRQMESRFRAAFPEAVAVVDPALQMRRKLAEARQAAGRADSGDFLPMIEKVALAAREVPAAGLRIGTYENGRLTLEFAAVDAAALHRLVARLTEAGFSVDTSTAPPRPGRGTVVITVRAS